MSPAGRDSGFTLIELMVTLALAGLLIALVPPMLGKGSDRARLAHDRKMLTSQLRLARSDAIASGHDVLMRFDLAGRRYGIGQPTRSLDPGIDVTLDSALDEGAAIRFFPDGSASGAILTLTNPSGHAALQVDWLTGKVVELP